MRPSIRTAIVTTAVAVVLALTASPASAKSYFAERFDSLIRVMPGGALEITETAVFRFESGTFDHVFREISTRLTDGIDILGASIDGIHSRTGAGVGRIEVFGPIQGAGAVAIRAGQRHEPRVRPHLPRARGRHAGSRCGRARVAGAAPRAPGSRIDASAIELVLPGPAGAAGERAATPRRRRAASIGRCTVHVESGPDDVTSPPLHARIIAGNRSVRTAGWKPPSACRRAASSPPHRLAGVRDRRGRSRAALACPRRCSCSPASSSSSGCASDTIRRRPISRRWAAAAPRRNRWRPLPVALMSNGRTTLEHAMGAMFSLAERGVIAIDEARGVSACRTSRCTRQRCEGAAGATRQALLATLFDTGHPEQTTLSSARNRVTRRLRPFGVAVRQELNRSGTGRHRSQGDPRSLHQDGERAPDPGRPDSPARGNLRQPVRRLADAPPGGARNRRHRELHLRRIGDAPFERGRAPGGEVAGVPVLC